MIGRWPRGFISMFFQISLLFVSISSIFLFVLVESKPPKSLNRMRQNKGTYNAAAFNSPSMINNGLLLADFNNNGTSGETIDSYEEYKDDIDHLLKEDLTLYDEEADTAVGEIENKSKLIVDEDNISTKEEHLEKKEVVEAEEVEDESEEYENEESDSKAPLELQPKTDVSSTPATVVLEEQSNVSEEEEEEEEENDEDRWVAIMMLKLDTYCGNLMRRYCLELVLLETFLSSSAQAALGPYPAEPLVLASNPLGDSRAKPESILT
ncbi:unnamed protein product [Caenorhabditis brenneri]